MSNINSQLRQHGETGSEAARMNATDYGKYNLYEKDEDFSKFDLDKMIDEIMEDVEGDEELQTEITGTGSAGVYTAKVGYGDKKEKPQTRTISEVEFEMEDGEDWESPSEEDVDEITGSASAGVYVTKAQFQKPKDFKNQKPAIRGGTTIEPNRNLKDPPKLHGQVGFKILKKSKMHESLDPKKIFDKDTKKAIVEYAAKTGQDVHFVTKSVIKRLINEGVVSHIVKRDKNTRFLDYGDYDYLFEKKDGYKHDGYMHKEVMDTYEDETGIFPDSEDKPSTVVNYKSLDKMKVGDLYDKKKHDKEMADVENGGMDNWEEYDVEPTEDQKKDMLKNTRMKDQPEMMKKSKEKQKRVKKFKDNRFKKHNIYGTQIED